MGLRTLVLCQKEISRDDFEDWNKDYAKATMALKDRELKMAKMEEELECDFELVGATAIEDKLQDQVPGTIKFMVDAGIKVWVLTGDKVETAMNIGFSAKLLTNEMEIDIIESQSSAQILQQIADFRKQQIAHEGLRDHALVVPGDALIKIMKNKKLTKEFMILA